MQNLFQHQKFYLELIKAARKNIAWLEKELKVVNDPELKKILLSSYNISKKHIEFYIRQMKKN